MSISQAYLRWLESYKRTDIVNAHKSTSASATTHRITFFTQQQRCAILMTSSPYKAFVAVSNLTALSQLQRRESLLRYDFDRATFFEHKLILCHSKTKALKME